MNKNQNFLKRLYYAWSGITHAFKNESSFRWQILMGLGALSLLVILKASAVWWALILLTSTGVLASELVNTAVEILADFVHPAQHPQIKILKDCMAGAVLVFSLAALGVLVAFLIQNH
jgi:diacylglycerol kinase (ATP)